MVADWTKTEAWDVLFLGNLRIPGIARVKVRRPTGVDIQKARGKKKAKVVDRGAEPARLDIEIEVDPDEMSDLQVAMNTISPRGKTKAQKYLRIEHPAAAFYGIGQVVIGDIESPHPSPGGNFFLRFEAYEHVNEPAKVKKPAINSEEENAAWNAAGLRDAALAETKPSQAVEQNFTAPEDVTNYSEQSGNTIHVPEPNYTPPP